LPGLPEEGFFLKLINKKGQHQEPIKLRPLEKIRGHADFFNKGIRRTVVLNCRSNNFTSRKKFSPVASKGEF